MKQLFGDCRTDAEKSNFFLSGRAVETGIIAAAISNDVAMAYHRCDEFKKELDTLRAKIVEMERQEPSEQDESVRKSWARFSHELHRSPDAPYPGMSEAFEQHFSQSFTDREWRSESGTWAAAWKAAKRHCAQPAPSVPGTQSPNFEVLGQTCIDGGKCHHGCDKRGRCFRRQCCSPFRDYSGPWSYDDEAPEAKP